MMIVSVQASAETERVIKFENQREEIFDLENWLKEITYTTEQRETTCYRTEYRTENVCRNVTRYRQECHTIPAHQECRTINDPICSYETRYERECRTVPGEQQCRVVTRYRRECTNGRPERQCRQVPGDVQCRIINGENRCTKIPPHEECRDVPGGQTCRDVPYEERECHTGPSRQECRDVPRQERVCRDNYRQVCETIPSERVCTQVPYNETVCADEQVPYQVPYSCTKPVQVPHETIVKTHKARVQVNFESKGAQLNSSFKIALSDKGDLAFTANGLASDVLAFLKKDIRKDDVGDINNITALYNVGLYSADSLAKFEREPNKTMTLTKEELEVAIKGKFEAKRATLAFRVLKKGEVLCDKKLKSSQFKSQVAGDQTKLSIDLEAIDCKVAGAIMFNKTRTIEMNLKLDFSDLGEVVGTGSKDISVSTSREVEIQ
jgi:hypothetical protein